ncbi:MAG: ABC transporter substrate-binding protein [Deltaproteobacteria bacterium]|nr:ABC transporter substrate-binding protein [Deltaproteobacteria bacterium]
MRRRVTMWGAAAAVVVGLVGSAPAAERLTVAYSALAGSQAALWVAQESGAFRRHGLEVSLIYLAGGSKAVQALLAGDVRMVQMGAPAAVVSANVTGAQLVFVGGVLNSILHFLVVAPEVTAATGLRGKTVGVTRFGSLSDLSARLILERLGLQAPREVAIVQTGGYPEALAAMQGGGIQGAIFTAPWHRRAERLGFRILTSAPEQGIRLPSTTLATSRSFLAARPELVRGFLQGFAEGMHRYKHDKEASLRVLAKYLRMTEREALESAHEDARFLEPRLALPLEGIRLLIEEVARHDPRARASKPEEHVDLRLVQELERDRFFDRLAAPGR